MQTTARLLPIGLVVTVGLVLGSPRSIGAASSRPTTADVPATPGTLTVSPRGLAGCAATTISIASVSPAAVTG